MCTLHLGDGRMMLDAIDDKKTRSRTMFRLSARQVETATGPNILIDGGGLLLRISDQASKRWLFRYTSPTTGSRREMGLGRAGRGHVSLAAAREAAQNARELIARKLDPIDVAEAERAERIAAARKQEPKTFGEFAEEWLSQNESQFRNAKHRQQWRNTLTTYGAALWNLLPSDITTQDVLKAVQPIWQTKPETARRTQGRIERILSAARAAGLRSGENPAQWRGHLDTLLPRRRKARHHPALPYTASPQFMRALRERFGVAARALEFLMLTAARSGEIRGMTWGELDADRKTWIISADRMKSGRAHRVPLCGRARNILEQMELLRPENETAGDLVFPGAKQGAPMSDMTLAAVLKRMRTSNDDLARLLLDERGDEVVVHGFRSTFRDWAEDVARFPARVVEAALAHAIKDKAEAAYRRGDAFEMRVELMDVWEAFLGAEADARKEEP